ncbi:MAG TPA: DEAD/DEAH box helicase, partial [Candidatus Krumholzibacteria bacterium]|nr:DEAD/DEAH box helicase [Candidatus Krumholzibacteria bacterium]
MLELRPYQQASVDAIYRHLRDRDDNPCVVIPTGGGKTPVMATVCRDAVGRWGGRVLILAHVKELLEQALEKIQIVAPEMWMKTGLYSAGLKSRDTEHPIIIAGIQSVYRRACELDAFDLVIIDEAHMIPPDGDGMYRTFLDDARKVNPNLRVIGLTATPFRMKSGMICEPGNVLNEVCYEIGVKELIVQGYLCPLVTKGAAEPLDTSGLHVRAGEFVAGEAEALMDTDELVESACREIVEQARTRRSVLVFTSGIKHAEHVAAALGRMVSEPVATVFGETASEERDQVLADFKTGRIKYLVNVNVLTTGFDAPNIDCVAMVRPTLSPGLYYQMVGRGFRLNEGKENCLVLDFGGNVLRHGPVDAIRVHAVHHRAGGEAPAKQCPECLSLIATGYTV